MLRPFNQKGNIIFSLALALLFSFISVGIVTVIINQINMSAAQRKNSKSRLMVTSSIETFQIALKHAEARYFISMRNCETGNPFYRALVEGHKCLLLQSSVLSIFNSSDLNGLNSDEISQFSYGSSWGINYDQKATGPTDRAILSMKIQGQTVKFFFYGATKAKDRADFAAEYDTSQGVSRVFFSVFASDSASKVHLNSSDVKLVNQLSYSKDPCVNTPWSEFSLMILGSCSYAANLGGGTGLAYNEGSYFGLRSLDGKVVSMKDLGGASYFVQEDGTLSGNSVFPPFKEDSLINVDDIEVMGLDQNLNKIVAVLGNGNETRIAYYDSGTNSMVTICKLGEMDFGRSFTGIAAAPGNQNILDTSSDMSSNVSSFYLKSDSGENVMVIIKAAGSVPYAGIEAQYITALAGKQLVCAAIKDVNEPAIEISRTLGLTKGGLLLRPYYIY